MTANSLLKNLLNIKEATVDAFDFDENAQGEPTLVVHVHVRRKDRWSPGCPEYTGILSRNWERKAISQYHSPERAFRRLPGPPGR